MEIDSTPVPPPSEYSDYPSHYPRESNIEATMDASSQTGPSAQGFVDDSKAIDRVISTLDNLDTEVEAFRKEALRLKEKRDTLSMHLDLIKAHDSLQTMAETQREEIFYYLQRVNARLSTVELSVRTVRDPSQEEALSQVNALISLMIPMDPVLSRQRCQQYLNACATSAELDIAVRSYQNVGPPSMDMDAGPVDKKFEDILLGCTLDDQKEIKRRLQNLMNYLSGQTIHRD